MELNEHGFLEELLTMSRDNWDTIPNLPTEMSDFFTSGWSNGCFDENPPSLLDHQDHNFSQNYCFTEDFSVPQFTDSSYSTTTFGTPPFLVQENVQENTAISLMEGEDHLHYGFLASNHEEVNCFKVEPIQSPEVAGNFNVGAAGAGFPQRKIRGKKLEGQPSKNLMAERRRRKRLNDRLSMLRSIVPKISKMDRTSILGDTIDYVKELMERINSLQQETEVGSNQLNTIGILKDTKPSSNVIRNTPKFDVERRDVDTRIEISSATKPGLLLSTLNTLEALGIEIQQCVISCFNDFAMQASCSEELNQQTMVSSEEIKQALFRNAGYGGRCL